MALRWHANEHWCVYMHWPGLWVQVDDRLFFTWRCSRCCQVSLLKSFILRGSVCATIFFQFASSLNENNQLFSLCLTLHFVRSFNLRKSPDNFACFSSPNSLFVLENCETQNIRGSKMFEAYFNSPDVLKHVFDAIKELLGDATFDCSNSGIQVRLFWKSS